MATEEVKFIFSMDDQFSQQAKKAEGVAAGLQRTLGQVGSMVAGAFSVGAVVNFEKSIVEAYGKMEMFKVALTTMLHGNVAETEALNDQLIQLAKTTPFELSDVQQGTKQLLAYGFEAGVLVDTMRTLGDVSAGVGSSLTDIAYLYGTLKTQDKVMSKDLYQFANRGIPILDMLAKRFKTTSSAIFDMASEGKIHFKDIEWAFKQMTGEGGQFFNLMEAQSKTVTGQISNLSDSWDQLKVSIGETQSGMIKESLSWAQKIVGDIQYVIDASNRMESAFAKHGAPGFSFWEDSWFSGESEEAEGLRTKRSKWHEKIQKSSTDESALKGLLKQQGLYAKELTTLFQRGPAFSGMTNEGYLREIAILKDVQEEIKGNLDLLSSKKKGSESASTEAGKDADKAKSQKYTNITINIDQVTGIENLTNKTEQQAGILSGEEITKFLIKGITDAQIVAGG